MVKLKQRFYLPSLADMLFMSIFLFLCLSMGQGLLGDGDTGYHIRAGEWILRNFSIPRFDIFSFHSPPIPWTAHEWLSEVIMALIHQYTGLTGIVVFFTFLLALTFYLLFLKIRDSGGNILIALFVVLLATAASQIHWLARPHVFSLLLFFLWYRILEEYRDGTRDRLYLLPPLMLLWVNLHGGYLSGFLLLGIFIAGEAPGFFSGETEIREPARRILKALAITTTVCLAVSCINPHGWHILLFPLKLVSNKLFMDSVLEFMSPNFHEPSALKYLILLLVALLAFSREKLRLTELLLLLVFLDMSLFSVRYIPLFAIIASPILVSYANILLEGRDGKGIALFAKKARNIAAVDASSGGIHWPIAAGLVVVWLTVTGAIHYGFDPKTKPVAAVRFLEQAYLPGNMFCNDEFGDYVIYAAWPRYKVFFDGRIDMYGTDMLKEYSKVTNFEDGWEKVLEKYRINWILFTTDSRFSRFLRERKDWALIYQDKVASIFIRDTESNSAITKMWGIEMVGPDRRGARCER
jgi:hypothetical protein